MPFVCLIYIGVISENRQAFFTESGQNTPIIGTIGFQFSNGCVQSESRLNDWVFFMKFIKLKMKGQVGVFYRKQNQDSRHKISINYEQIKKNQKARYIY